MDLARAEGMAVEFYERLGFDPSEPVSTYRLACKALGEKAVVRAPTLVTPAATYRMNGQRRIALKTRIAPEYAGFYIGHELGHMLLEEEGYAGEDEEQMADMIGAALMAPMPAIRSMIRAFGRDAFEDIAAEACSTETWAALRVAEALRIPRAVLTPIRAYVRGPEEFVWGPEDELRRLTRGRRPGVTKMRLHDDPRRWVIDIEEIETA